MSRRVFDVGLDMSRMRESLKSHRHPRRSRSSNTGKQNHTKSSTPPDDILGSQQLAMVPQLKRTRSKSLNEAAALGGSPERPMDMGHPEDLRSQNESPNFDLKPPPPNIKVKHIDTLAEKLLSGNHLDIILNDPSFFLRFTAFLNRYKPNIAPTLVQYLEMKKAIKAVEYANALSESLQATTEDPNSPDPVRVASLEPEFKAWGDKIFNSLVTDALPAYVTTCLTKVVTEYMIKEITGAGMPVHRELVSGLAETFCLSDPNQEDCPIIYASEEFYRTTRYSRDDSLGRNCRFLQGSRSDEATVERLRKNIRSGQESCECILNYRRDGSPFMNLLLIAPLYDNRGAVKYFIGAQVDISGLIENGRGLDSFERLLNDSRPSATSYSNQNDDRDGQKHLKPLEELSQMLSVDESSLFQGQSREGSTNGDASNYSYSTRVTPRKQQDSARRARKILGNEEEGEVDNKNPMPLSASLTSGRLPGVYQNYLLVRPHPSLRILFVSASLRVPGILQSPFLAHIDGSQQVISGVTEAFEQGAAVTAKVNWCPKAHDQGRDDSSDKPSPDARTRYISCTPLLGSDDKVGVWMVVMVENEPALSGNLRRPPRTPDRPIENGLPNGIPNGNGGKDSRRKGAGGGEDMYADYMRHSATTSMDSERKQHDENMDDQVDEASVKGPVNGLKDEDRVQEVFTPTEEKRNMGEWTSKGHPIT
ncbi:uncharacterized protein KY384_002054 [Bacidia gigantensis]|uniref:uncharacterized protein n=1 Tax=Bacidia gigantensis TaxID=2732470 RepID=UPI001D04E8B7|nr:uncharacterized protein KY384_002054 [Bacidia gigantensis]KAG8533271.1 hypothetical protein KY384_002054 [Bacidia gigantensis]